MTEVVNKFTCEFCTYNSERLYNLKRHTILKHPNTIAQQTENGEETINTENQIPEIVSNKKIKEKEKEKEKLKLKDKDKDKDKDKIKEKEDTKSITTTYVDTQNIFVVYDKNNIHEIMHYDFIRSILKKKYDNIKQYIKKFRRTKKEKRNSIKEYLKKENLYTEYKEYKKSSETKEDTEEDIKEATEEDTEEDTKEDTEEDTEEDTKEDTKEEPSDSEEDYSDSDSEEAGSFIDYLYLNSHILSPYVQNKISSNKKYRRNSR